MPARSLPPYNCLHALHHSIPMSAPLSNALLAAAAPAARPPVCTHAHTHARASAVLRGTGVLLLVLACWPVQGQTFKCVDTQGRLSYQQAPCTGDAAGQTFVDEVTRQREHNRAQYRDTIAQERNGLRQQQVQEMERLRQAVLQAGQPDGAASAAPTAPAALPDTATLLGLGEDESVVPSEGPAQRQGTTAKE